jgi:hypothetical protein
MFGLLPVHVSDRGDIRDNILERLPSYPVGQGQSGGGFNVF